MVLPVRASQQSLARRITADDSFLILPTPGGASSTTGGKGNLPVLDEDKAVAAFQGESFGKLVSTFVKGAAA